MSRKLLQIFGIRIHNLFCRLCRTVMDYHIRCNRQRITGALQYWIPVHNHTPLIFARRILPLKPLPHPDESGIKRKRHAFPENLHFGKIRIDVFYWILYNKTGSAEDGAPLRQLQVFTIIISDGRHFVSDVINIHNHLHHTDLFIVNTGINLSFHFVLTNVIYS